jgi:hypothetical protein
MAARDIEDLTFTDETGADVRLGDYLRDLDDAQTAQAVVDACTLGAR